MPKGKTSPQSYKVNVDFSAPDAWEAADKYNLIRRFGAQIEADRRMADPLTRAMIEWATQHPREGLRAT